MSYLEDRFQKLWENIGAKGDSKVAFSDLFSRYNESYRRYHNLSHIEHCLSEFDTAKHLLDEPLAVELAIWWHDSDEDELQSARLFKVAARSAKISESIIQYAFELILVTKPGAVADFKDKKFIQDIDRSILGQSEEVFDKYEMEIRSEYAWVGEEEFRSGRSKILKMLISSGSIYSTEFFREKYEQRAVENIARSIAKLAV